jgi:hypothetical protein
MANEKKKPRFAGLTRVRENLQATRERRERGELTKGERRIAGARSGVRKGREFLAKGRDFAHRHKLTSKARGGKSPGEYLGSELRKSANNAPLIGTMTRKRGIRNQ